MTESGATSGRKKTLLDVDTGIDDAIAILLALASPELELRGISVASGNVPATQGTLNTLGLLELAGSHVRVERGFEEPLVRPLVTAFETHGPSGVGNTTLPAPRTAVEGRGAVDMIISEVMGHPGDITLVATAPLTNVAVAFRQEPRVAPSLAELIIMGGALRVPGNVTAAAEFNFYVDPDAASIVLNSGAPITLLPLDITERAILTAEHIAQIGRHDSVTARFAADALSFYLDFHVKWDSVSGCFMHDPLALALAFAPHMADFRPAYVDVETTGKLALGGCVSDYLGRRPHQHQNVRLVDRVDVPAFLQLLVDRLIGGPLPEAG